MFGTLICLAVSMTGAAWLLAWIDPMPPVADASVAAQEAVAQARALVEEGWPSKSTTWAEIEIVAAAPLAGTGALLRATGTADEAEFIVDVSGHLVPGSRWARERDSAVIRIAVAKRGANEPMTTAQWLTTRALVTAVNERTCPSGKSLPIRLAPTWREAYGLPEGTVFQLAEPGF